MREDAQNLLIMNKKNYRTLDGLYKALFPIVNNLGGAYKIERNEDDIAIFCNNYQFEPMGSYAITKMLPVLKRANWMVRCNGLENRVELLVWINDDII